MEGITSPPMVQGSSTNSMMNSLFISMLGIFVTSLAIMAYHLILVKYCIRRHSSTTTAAAQPATGVDEKVLKTIPMVAFSDVKRYMDQLEECVVCLGELENDDVVRLLPNCRHAFHVGCIDRWLAAHTSCPLCRSPMHERSNAAQSLHPHRTDDSDSGGGINESSGSDQRPPSPREQSFGLLRHCASLVLPSPPMTERRSLSRLKRSQSSSVINLERENCWSDSSSSSCSRRRLSRSGSCSARYMSHFDRTSSKWLRSFSWLRVGKGTHGAILPY